jgi:hypothetical protein
MYLPKCPSAAGVAGHSFTFTYKIGTYTLAGKNNAGVNVKIDMGSVVTLTDIGTVGN